MRVVRAGKVALTAAVVAVLVVTVPSAAGATTAPPRPFVNKSIVVQKSIGGIALGRTVAQVNRTLHRKYCTANGCTYTDRKHTYTVTCLVVSALGNPKARIGRITVQAASTRAAVRSLRTGRNIGIGSSRAQVRKAYPKARSAKGQLYLGSARGRTTSFYFTSGRVTEVVTQNASLS